MSQKKESIEVPTQVQDETKPAVEVKILNRYRVEKVGKDAYVFERIKLSDQYAGKEGILEFEGPGGKITYYTEKLVKKYSENVVKA